MTDAERAAIGAIYAGIAARHLMDALHALEEFPQPLRDEDNTPTGASYQMSMGAIGDAIQACNHIRQRLEADVAEATKRRDDA